MIPWVELDAAEMPDGGGRLRLMQRGQEFSIMAGPIELMNSRLSGSEEALATLAAERLAGRRGPRILIGGLGMGFTLRAALAAIPQSQIVVCELVPAVVEWARGPLAPLHATALTDPRVTIEVADVANLVTHPVAPWDAILLDVDNGPEGLTRRANDALYDLPGLARAKAALTPGGLFAVWSSAPNAEFTRRMNRSGFAKVEEIAARARGKRGGARHVIWIGTR